MKTDKNMSFLCTDCGVNTCTIDEYYMVCSDTWNKATKDNPAYMLCIGCLETRLQRNLTSLDFALCPLNVINITKGSERLRDRIDGNLNTYKKIIWQKHNQGIV